MNLENFWATDLYDLDQKYQNMTNEAALSISKKISELIKKEVELNVNEIVKETEKEIETIIPSDTELVKSLKEILTADIVRYIVSEFDLDGKI